MKKLLIMSLWLFLAASNSYSGESDWVSFRDSGKAFFQARLYDMAIKEYTKALERVPDDGRFLYGLYLYRGQAYSYEKLYDHAISDLTTAIYINPYDVAAYSERANTYAQRGWYQQAFIDFDKALSLKPDDGLTYLYRAKVYYSIKEYKKAWGDLKQARIYGQKIKDKVMQDYEKKALGRVKSTPTMDLY